MHTFFSTTCLTPCFQDHTNNFGHPAIRDLLHVFLYSRDNRLGNLQQEFGHHVPNGTLSLAATAVSSNSQFTLYYHVIQIRCILDGYKMYGKTKYPTFSGSLYHSKWHKFLVLIEQLEGHHVHGPKLDRMCREIARSGV